MANYHVSKDKQKGLWRVKKEGGDNVSRYTSTQKSAEHIAKGFSANNGGCEVRIHGLNG